MNQYNITQEDVKQIEDLTGEVLRGLPLERQYKNDSFKQCLNSLGVVYIGSD